VDTSGDPSFFELLNRVRDTCLDAQAHQDAPYEKVVHELRSGLAAEPLIDVLFVLHSNGSPTLSLTGADVRRVARPPQPPAMELVVVLIDEGDRIAGRFDYAGELFEASSIGSIVEQYLAIVDAVVRDPHRPLSEIVPARPEGQSVEDPVGHSPTEIGGGTDGAASATQSAVAAIWASALGLLSVDTDDDFFDVGGASLIAVQVISRIQEQFAVELTVRQFFEHPTVGKQSALIERLLHRLQ
jgi:non-ribosomal peptide synthetase component F